MRETQEDIERLQALLDNSIGRAGAFLRRSFQMPEHSLTAQQLIDCWLDVQTVALATVTTRGEPRIAPIGSLLYRGDIYIPTVATAARTRHVMKRPAVSLTLFRENELAIIVHGYAAIISPDHADFETLENLCTHTPIQRLASGAKASTFTSRPRPSTPTTGIPTGPSKAFLCR